MEVNGKFYPLWGQFVEKEGEWIGGTLQEVQDSFPVLSVDSQLDGTDITGIELKPNGEGSAFFEVSGKDYSCGADVRHLGIIGGEEGWITLSGYGGHTWRIKKPEKK